MEIINREHWLTELVKRLEPMLEEHNKKMPKWRISMSFPVGRARPSKKTGKVTLGQCWAATKSKDGTRELLVSPIEDDPIKIAGTVLHEMCHAVLPPEVGHKAMFARLARACGLVGKPTETEVGDALKNKLEQIVADIGEYPHAALDASSSRMPRTPQRKSMCPMCGYVARITSVWLDGFGHPICPNCYVPMIEPDIEEDDRIQLESMEQHIVFKVRGEDDRFEIRMYKRGPIQKWLLADYGISTVTVDGKPNPDALFNERTARVVPVEGREEAVNNIEAIREGLFTLDDLIEQEAEEDVELEDIPEDTDTDKDWLEQLEEEDETPDYPDSILTPEELREYEEEERLREARVKVDADE